MKMETRIKIRKAYKKHMHKILALRIGSFPYDIGIDWIDKLSPIEEHVWSSIRYLGLPFYPQFPVGPYFLDFGDPVRKIGIEVDSRRWHQDEDKDLRRQAEIEAEGWEIHRFPSRMVYTIRDDFNVLDDNGENPEVDRARYTTESAEGYLLKLYQDNDYFEQRAGGMR